MPRSRIVHDSAAPVQVVEAFVFQPLPSASPPTEAASNGNDTKSEAAGAVQLTWAAPQASPARKYSEEDLQGRLQAKEQGFREAEATLRAEYENALAMERAKVGQALQEFGAERQLYFQRVESEVVRLALSIARKILHREAQVDPLLLSGVVRVALEKVAEGSAVKLRVPERESFKWRQIVATLKDVRPLPQVIGDPALGPARCVLETEVGSTNLSLETQLEEIERGLLDLIALRPAS